MDYVPAIDMAPYYGGDAATRAALGRAIATACAELGSRFYGTLLERLADDAEAGGPTARVLAGHEHDPIDTLISLRLLGGVHHRVLLGLEPQLAAHYPSVGGDGDADAALGPLLDVLDARADELRGALARPPQTNEVGRCAALASAPGPTRRATCARRPGPTTVGAP